MEKSIQKAPRSPFLLSVLGTLIIGLTLGRYLIPATVTSPPEPSAQEPRIPLSERRLGQAIPPAESSGPSHRKPPTRPDRSNANQKTVLADILNQGNPFSRTREMLDFIDRLDDRDIANVVDGFRESGWVDFNRNEFSLLISAWMGRDPHNALSYLEQNDTNGWTRKTAISAWAAEDPSAATAAIIGLDDPGLVNDWVVGLAEGMARNDPNGALSIVAGLSSKETRDEALREIVPEVVIRGPEFATEWLDRISDPDLQRSVAKHLAATMGRRDPQAASEWITTLASPETRRDASGMVAEVYAREDLQGAKDWVSLLPAETASAAAPNVARLLARESPTEAALWLRGLGNAPSLDIARIRFLQEAGPQDPVTALENVPTLSKARDQERYYRDILSQWHKSDQAAAVAWATTHSESIPPKVLRSILPKPR